MKLLRYKVTNFRSVKDSGWINCDDVTTLVGINEAGKSNLLLALWKLNPASGGEIDYLHDMPVNRMSEMRSKQAETDFISAQFEISPETAQVIGDKVGCDITSNNTVTVSRFYDGHYSVTLEGEDPKPITEIVSKEDENGETVEEEVEKEFSLKALDDEIIDQLPRFVYYSNYGNLSSRIYLPNVVKWLKNETVPGIDINEDQVRTLRVLFKFVNLVPQEILDLGKDADAARNGQIPEKEILRIEKKKEERSLLLQSASTTLTTKFRNWWKQGEYKFRFEADGDYFRIWVSDKKRPEEVSLELRSTGLQWFLSFYLVFLVESGESHKNAILLLDEAGLTLHPLAQKDLSKFFNELSLSNQIINTTHSPFIVDTNNIDRCKVVYVDEDGYTVASDNLRQGNDKLNEQSIYAVHAALGLTVSDILLQGCKPVIVEGASDQIYMNAAKQWLISQKKISPLEEIVFIPSGGVKGIPGVVSILCGKEGELPYVIVDSDKSGCDCSKKLTNGLYHNDSSKIIQVGSLSENCIENAEIEDIVPYGALQKGISRMFISLEDEEFEYDSSKPIINQIQEFAHNNSVDLTDKGWKVELAKKAKKNILKNGLSDKENLWISLFNKFV